MSAVLETPIRRPTAEGSRLVWVDIAKGIGIVLVVFGHVWRGLHAAHFAIPPETYQWVDRLIYSFHMPLFFVLSGLFIPKSVQKPASVFLLDKLKTIAYPYVLWTLIQASVNAALSSVTTTPVSLGQILFEMPWRPYAHFWFLYVLFFHSVAYLALDRLRVSRGLILALAAVLHLLTYRINMQSLGIFTNVLTNFVYFAAGAALSEFLLNRAVHVKPFATATLAVATGALLLLAITTHFDQRLSDKLPLTVLGIVAVMAGSIWLAHKSAGADLSAINIGGVLASCGRLSLVIYLAHILAASGMRIVLQKLLHVDNLATHLILGTLAGITGPMALDWAAKRVGVTCLFAWR
jgi:fucose 4-O-acetylase-like acetyltransferase